MLIKYVKKYTIGVINFILIISIIYFSIYIIELNGKIDSLYRKYIFHHKAYAINTQINNQLRLELSAKTSNIFVENYAKKELKMYFPKKIHNF